MLNDQVPVFSYKHQGKVLVDYLKERGANSKRNKWKYGRFDGLQGVNSPLELDTDILDKIWDLIDPEHRKLFSNYSIYPPVTMSLGCSPLT